MLQKIKTKLTTSSLIFAASALILLSSLVPALIPAGSGVVSACTISGQINNGLNAATGNNTSDCTTTPTTSISTGVKGIAVTAVNILSVVVGIVAVIMIIYGGFRYITSGGESGNVSSAKNTLLFAIVGLVIVALAQVIVRWVLGTSTNLASTIVFTHFLR